MQYREPWVLLCQHSGVGTPVNFLRECACSFHAGDEDFGQEHCTKMFPTWWAASTSNPAAVSLYCCLLQCCPLPILPFLPKENAHWRADSSAQWGAVLKLVLSPGFRVLSRHEQEWMALGMSAQLRIYPACFWGSCYPIWKQNSFCPLFAGSCQICLICSLHLFYSFHSCSPSLAVSSCPTSVREVNCLIKRYILFVLQLLLLYWGANTEDLHLGGDNVSAWEICFLSDFSGSVLMAGE